MKQWEYVKLLDLKHKNQIVRADGRFQQHYQNGKWVRSGILLHYFSDESPTYDMYEDISEDEAITILGKAAINQPV